MPRGAGLLLVMRCAWAFVGRRQIAATPRRSLRSQATDDDWFSPAQRAALPSVDASQWARLEAAARHLFDWNAKVNVVSRKDLDRRKLVELHYLPSLALLNVPGFAAPVSYTHLTLPTKA